MSFFRTPSRPIVLSAHLVLACTIAGGLRAANPTHGEPEQPVEKAHASPEEAKPAPKSESAHGESAPAASSKHGASAENSKKEDKKQDASAHAKATLAT